MTSNPNNTEAKLPVGINLDDILIKLQNAGTEVGLQGAGEIDPKYSIKEAKQAIALELNKAREGGLLTAKELMLARTRIPADAKNPTRDLTVIIGEECVKVIDMYLESGGGQVNLQGGNTND